MPLALRACLAVAVIVAAVVAVRAPAPSARARQVWLKPALTGVFAAAIWSAAAFQAGWPAAGPGLMALAALMLALAAWLHRGDEGGRPPGPDPDDDGPEPPGPSVDWERWEREVSGPGDRQPVG